MNVAGVSIALGLFGVVLYLGGWPLVMAIALAGAAMAFMPGPPG